MTQEHFRPSDFVSPLFEEGTTASYPVLPLEQNKQKFYFATMPVADIFPYCFVVRRQEDPTAGFQRELNGERARSISAYLDRSVGSIPTNIVLSAQPDAEVQYKSRNKTLSYKRHPRAFLVLDGQHRLFGYGLTKKKHRVPVAIYEGLTRADEAALFIDINTNQRGVPASLLLDIKQVAERENETERKLRVVFDRLGKDAESPLNGLTSAARSLPGRISRVTFNRGMRDVLENPVMVRLSEDKQYQLLKNYLRAVEHHLKGAKVLRKSAYFEAFCDLFAEVVRLSMGKMHDLKYESLLEILSPVGNFDIQQIATRGRTKITKGAIYPVLKTAICEHVEVTEDMV